MELIKNHQNTIEKVVFGLFAHLFFVIIYLVAIPTFPLAFKTPFGMITAAIFPGAVLDLLIVAIVKKLGAGQAIGVIATSYSLYISISPKAYALQSALGKASCVLASILVFQYLSKKFSEKITFLAAYGASMFVDAAVVLLTLHQGSAIPAAWFIFFNFLVVLGVTFWALEPKEEEVDHWKPLRDLQESISQETWDSESSPSSQ